MKGKLIIIAAPSGSGKTSIVKYLLEKDNNLSFSISATTRQKRKLEEHGKDYFFISEADFVEKIRQNEFLEWQEVYKGTFYGTLKSEVDKNLNEGKNIIFDVDVVGGINIKKIYKEQALAIFIKPPTIEILEQRLLHRGTEGDESLRKRLEKAAFELTHEVYYDCTIINDNLDQARFETKRLIDDFIAQ